MVEAKLIDRLRKIMAHEVSARSIGSVKEADAFAEKIQDLLLTHKLSLSEVEFRELEQEEPVGELTFEPDEHGFQATSRRLWWQETLAGIIVKANDCELLLRYRSNTVFFVGRTSDRETCAYVFTLLLRGMIAEAEAGYKKLNRHDPERSNFKKSFYYGAIEELSQRMKRTRQRAEAGADSTALVRMDRTKQAVDEYLGRKKTHTASACGPSHVSGSGVAAGRQFGKSATWSGASGALKGKPREIK